MFRKFIWPDENNELVALTDPTLFVLPHAEGFNTLVGQHLNTFGSNLIPLDGAAAVPAIAPATLGANFADYMRTNQFPATALDLKPPPQVALVVHEI